VQAKRWHRPVIGERHAVIARKRKPGEIKARACRA
jgi:hypothetical protein